MTASKKDNEAQKHLDGLAFVWMWHRIHTQFKKVLKNFPIPHWVYAYACMIQIAQVQGQWEEHAWAIRQYKRLVNHDAA